MAKSTKLHIQLISRDDLRFMAEGHELFQVMQKTHYYLVDTSVIIPGAAVSDLQFNIIKEEPFTVHNLEVRNNLLAMAKFPSFSLDFFHVIFIQAKDIFI